MSYYEKYLKYKNKYLTLKKQIGGNHCTGFFDDKYKLKYTGCKTIENKCKFDYENLKDITDSNKQHEYNIKLGKEILDCKPTLKQLLDAGYTILEIQQKINLPFTFPEIVEYNKTATKKIVFNDMNMLNFGTIGTSISIDDKFKFTTCYEEFDYSNLTNESVNAINYNIIGRFAFNGKPQENKYLEMIIYFAKIILSQDLVGKNVLNFEKLATSGMRDLHNFMNKIYKDEKLEWKEYIKKS